MKGDPGIQGNAAAFEDSGKQIGEALRNEEQLQRVLSDCCSLSIVS